MASCVRATRLWSDCLIQRQVLSRAARGQPDETATLTLNNRLKSCRSLSLWTKSFLLTYAFSLLWRKSKHSRTWNNGTPIMIYTSKIKFGRTLMGKTCNLVVKPLAINFFFCTWRGLSCMKNVQRYAVCDLFAVTSILCNAHVQFPNRLQACQRVDWVHCKKLEYTWTINLHSGFFGVLNGTSVCCLYMKFSFHRRIK